MNEQENKFNYKMNKNIQFTQINGLVDLSNEEINLINGGDKFTNSFGNLIGDIGGAIANAWDCFTYIARESITRVPINQL